MTKPQKPQKPRPDFPLFAHASGQWAKKIKGKLEYFGPWAQPEVAEARYLAKYPHLQECPIISDDGKTAKPYPDFPLSPTSPLSPHPNGQWCKRIRGRIHYFGTIGDWQAALTKYQDEKDDLHAGRQPRPKDGLTVSDLCNPFLRDRGRKAEAGEINPRTGEDYKWAVKRLLRTKKPERLVAKYARRWLLRTARPAKASRSNQDSSAIQQPRQPEGPRGDHRPRDLGGHGRPGGHDRDGGSKYRPDTRSRARMHAPAARSAVQCAAEVVARLVNGGFHVRDIWQGTLILKPGESPLEHRDASVEGFPSTTSKGHRSRDKRAAP